MVVLLSSAGRRGSGPTLSPKSFWKQTPCIIVEGGRHTLGYWMIWAAHVVDAAQLCTTYRRHQKAYPKPARAASVVRTSANFRPAGPHPVEIRIAIVFISQGVISQGEYPAGAL